MICSQFIVIYISIEMFYISYYKHKYCPNYGNQFILKQFDFFPPKIITPIYAISGHFFLLLLLCGNIYNNISSISYIFITTIIIFRNIAMIKKNVLLRPKLQRCLSVVYVVHTAMIHISVPSRLQRLAVMKKVLFWSNANNQKV